MLKHIPFYASLLAQGLANDAKTSSGHVLVYGAIEVHSMGIKGCTASNKTIGSETGLSTKRVANILSELNSAGWIHVELNEKRERLSIIPLMVVSLPSEGGYPADGIGVSRESDTGYPVKVNIDNNKENSKNIVTSEMQENVDKLYRGWLIEFVIGYATWVGLSESERSSSLLAATKKVRLTEKRRQKLISRLKDLDYKTCALAIKHLAASDFHKGDNDRKWTATLEWLFNSVEKTEEWANRK